MDVRLINLSFEHCSAIKPPLPDPPRVDAATVHKVEQDGHLVQIDTTDGRTINLHFRGAVRAHAIEHAERAHKSIQGLVDEYRRERDGSLNGARRALKTAFIELVDNDKTLDACKAVLESHGWADEFDNLPDAVASLCEGNQSLAKDAGELASEFDNLRELLDCPDDLHPVDVVERVLDLDSALERCSEQREALTGRVNSLTADHEHFRDRAEQAERRCSNLDDIVQSLRNKVDRIRRDLDCPDHTIRGIRNHIASLQKERENLANRVTGVDAIQDERDELAQQIDKAHEALPFEVGANSSLGEEIRALLLKRREFETKYEDALASCRELRKKLNAKSKKVRTFKRRLEKCERTNKWWSDKTDKQMARAEFAADQFRAGDMRLHLDKLDDLKDVHPPHVKTVSLEEATTLDRHGDELSIVFGDHGETMLTLTFEHGEACAAVYDSLRWLTNL
ncbi:MAG: hypothetical protein U5L04_01805 [Trueperaceae bacterium]|nr:hypothetical protein [Trueperaceae bacterium]